MNYLQKRTEQLVNWHKRGLISRSKAIEEFKALVMLDQDKNAQKTFCEACNTLLNDRLQ